MKNRSIGVAYTEGLLEGAGTVEELAKRKDIIVGSYEMPGSVVGVIVGVNSAENYQCGCAHFITGHEEIQKIEVKQTSGDNKVVALYKVISGEGELYHNGNISTIKKGDVIKFKNGDEYCMAGDFVVVEIFEPMFSETTHTSTGEKNPLLTGAMV